MSRLVKVAIAMTALLGAPEFASAEGGCPDGYAPRGKVCKPFRGSWDGPGTGLHFNPANRYQGGQPGYYVPDQPGYYIPGRGYHIPGKPCPEGYTVQQGRCKPYRGPWR